MKSDNETEAPWTEEAASGSGRFQYELTEDRSGIRILNYDGSLETEIRIPEEIDGLPVRILGRHTFYDSGISISSIIMPASMRELEPEALEFCVSLEHVKLNHGLRRIGRNALNATQVTELTIPNTVEDMEFPGEWELALHLEEGNPNHREIEYGIFQIRDDGAEVTKKPETTEELTLEAVHAEYENTAYTLPKNCVGISEHALYQARNLRKLVISSPHLRLSEGSLTVLQDPDLENTFSEGNQRHRLQVELQEKSPSIFITDGCVLQKEGQKLTLIYTDDQFTGDLSAVWKKVSELTGTTEFVIGEEACSFSKVTEVRLPVAVSSIHSHAFQGCHLKEAILEEPEGPDTIIRFPSGYGYLMNSLMESFGKNGYRYDFTAYTEAILEGSWVQDKLRMAASRLRQRKHLRRDEEERIRSRISRDILPIVSLLEELHDGETLQELVDLHFFDETNTDQAIEILNNGSSRELLPILLNAKKGQKKQSFDFSL